MALLHEILAHNERFVAERKLPLTGEPRRKLVIFTCMDTRLVEFLEPALGIRRGDAKVIKNAGATLIDPQGGVIRSLVVAIHVLGCEEILVIGHTDCGMTKIDEAELERRMVESGVPAEAIARLRPSLKEWVGAFHHPIENVEDVVERIRSNPLIPERVPVHGLVFDPAEGRLRLVADGYAAAGREAATSGESQG